MWGRAPCRARPRALTLLHAVRSGNFSITNAAALGPEIPELRAGAALLRREVSSQRQLWSCNGRLCPLWELCPQPLPLGDPRVGPSTHRPGAHVTSVRDQTAKAGGAPVGTRALSAGQCSARLCPWVESKIKRTRNSSQEDRDGVTK